MENESLNQNLGRELPYSQEAEQSVIGGILSNAPSCVGDAVEILKPSDFYFAQHAIIFKVITELFNENSAIDFVTVANRLSRDDKLDTVGGTEYLKNAATGVPTTRNVAYYSNIVREKSILRNLIACSERISDMAYNAADKPDKILEQAEQLIFDVSSDREQNDIMRISDVLYTSYQQLVEDSQNEGGITGLSTGFHELNRRTGGFHGGELILIAGRPGMGKSSFAVNIAEYVSISEKKTVAIFNLEMPKEQIVNRILCSQALVNSHKIRAGEMEPDDWRKIGEIVNKVELAPMYIDDTASITVSQIRAKCRRLKQTQNLAMVVIDYLQLMQSSGRTDSRQQEIAEISRSLKILAKELDVPVIALSQLSRASESRSDKRPMLSDLRESGAIEQDADMVMFLYRDDYYNKDTEEKNIAECIVAKNRSGETGTFKLGWKGEFTKFSNLEYVMKEEEH
ncbi:MAG: replicative DNA helicase [Clostridia bacterium]|nr:replicative DNA helicase [Clostridia bacterium]